MTPTVHTDSAVVHTANLSLEFSTDDGPVHALSNINLDIAPGEFISLIGPSGCGKTTLLRVIADLETHTDGRFRSMALVRAKPGRVGHTAMFFRRQRCTRGGRFVAT